jgi:hypothetical protein
MIAGATVDLVPIPSFVLTIAACGSLVSANARRSLAHIATGRAVTEGVFPNEIEQTNLRPILVPIRILIIDAADQNHDIGASFYSIDLSL